VVALDATGLPDKTRQVVEDSLHLLQKSQEQVSEEAMDRANQFAEDARKHAKHAGKNASKYARKHANEYLRNASEYADKYAKNASKYADKYAQDLPDVLKEKFQKRQSKRFIFG
jgi:vacuolar-type H+-ATPase subunit H